MSEETISGFFPTNAPNLIKVNLTLEEIEQLEKDLYDRGYGIYSRKKVNNGWANMNELISKQDELINIYKKQIEMYQKYMDDIKQLLNGGKNAAQPQKSTKNWTEESGFKKAPNEKKAKSFKDFLSWFNPFGD